MACQDRFQAVSGAEEQPILVDAPSS